MKKFTIITACYNNEKYLGDYFKSILNQDYPNIEIIFVDDCSTDHSLECARTLSDERVKIISNPTRQYCANSYQTAVNNATGDICGVVDADDVLMSGAVKRIVELYARFNVGFIYSQSWWCNAELKPRRTGLSRLPEKGKLLEMGRRLKHCYSHWRTFKTCLNDKKPLFEKDLKCAVDKSLGYMLEERASGGFVNEFLYMYRYHKENMSHMTKQRVIWKKVVERAVIRRNKNSITAKGVRQIK